MESNQKLKLIKDLGYLYPNENSKRTIKYCIYKCYCGKEFKTAEQSVKRGLTKSCGCLSSKVSSDRNRTHGLTHHRLYYTWLGMMQRCYNHNSKPYEFYGAKGVTVCEEWHSVENFINDMYPSFIEGLTLDRIDVYGNYNKNNCRWANRSLQNSNTRLISKTNKSGYRGVSYHKIRNKWRSRITINKKEIYLGLFENKLDAAKAYDKYIIDNNLQYPTNGVI